MHHVHAATNNSTWAARREIRADGMLSAPPLYVAPLAKIALVL